MTLWKIELLGRRRMQSSRKLSCAEKQWNIVSELWLQVWDVWDWFSKFMLYFLYCCPRTAKLQPQKNVSGKMLHFHSGRKAFNITSYNSNKNNLGPRNRGKIRNFFNREAKTHRTDKSDFWKKLNICECVPGAFEWCSICEFGSKDQKTDS